MMKEQQLKTLDPRTQQAITELMQIISDKHPGATFKVARDPDEPSGTDLKAIVDLEDPDEVLDLVGDRLLELRVEEHILIDVVALRTPERVSAALEVQTRSQRPRRTHSIPRLSRPL